MKKFYFYMHGGSGNRGCEAIVRSTFKILDKFDAEKILLSHEVEEDKEVGLNEICSLEQGKNNKNYNVLITTVSRALYRAFRSQHLNYFLYHESFNEKNYLKTLAFSIGGDNYCYKGSPELLGLFNKKVKKDNGLSVLWGCSIEPSYLDRVVIKDLKRYDLITARESITYNALKQANVENVRLYPDPAFVLDKQECELPTVFLENNTIGINLSPHAMKYSVSGNMAKENYMNLIQWILDNSDMNVLLIPHVEKGKNSDINAMKTLFESFKDTERVGMLKWGPNCKEMKYLISKCRFFVGARTHSTIAAYSSSVPTLVMGYSVKARGIARDIFGSEEGYVVETQNLKSNDDLVVAFKKIYNREDEIRAYLQGFMPNYIEKAWKAGEEIKRLIVNQK